MPRTIAEFHGVSKVYRTGLLRRRATHALRGVDLTVPRGAVFGLIGPNRAGKTTLVKLLLSICRPTAGAIVRLGRPARDRSTLCDVGYLHESLAFPPYLTAATLLDYYAALSLVPSTERRRRIPQLLEQVGLADRAHEAISTFSKGMVQRLALAQALVNDPQLLVLDEPSEGMDLVARKLLDDVIRRRQREGKTAILVSHDLSGVQRLCDEVALLREGQVVYNGPLAGLTGQGSPCVSSDALAGILEPLYTGVTL